MHSTHKKNRRPWVLAVVLIAACWASTVQCVFAAPYNECRLPPQIAFTAVPNVLMVLDYSGSMQFPAYYDSGRYFDNCGGYAGTSHVANLYCGTSSITNDTYDPNTDYYGLFEIDSYYTYDFENGWFVVKSYEATETPPTNRIGNFGVGVSGNLLNWALASRMDTAMKALIGGKQYAPGGGDCGTDPDSPCYLKGEGARRYLRGSTSGTNNIDADFYIRPATWAAATSSGYAGTWSNLPSGTGPFPDDYASPAASYPLKDLVVSIKANYRGRLDSADPTAYSKYYEMWSFTVAKRTVVELSLTGSWGSALWKIYATADAPEGSYLASFSGSPATGSVLLEAGTYYVRAAPANTHSPSYVGDYTLLSNVHLTPANHSAHNGAALTHTVGAIPYAAVRLRISPGTRAGVVQATWQKIRWGAMYFKSDATVHAGRLLVRCGEATSATDFAKYLEGKVLDSKAGANQPYPYWGTPTGEALDEALHYFKQDTGGHWGGPNDDKIDRGGQWDPFYALKDGTYQPVTCRKSYTILVSDGNWNGSIDPIKPAYDFHSGDMRTGIDGIQNVTLFSIFSFNDPSSSEYTAGSNSMQWTALYGGWRELPGCKNGWPYGTSGYNIKSDEKTFCIKGCPNLKCPAPRQAVPDACCKEWDLNNDLYEPGDGLGKGIPDNYYEPQTGGQLRDTLVRILLQVEQQNASSSAVATVAQQTGEGDIIIRGMFQAKPPDGDTANTGKYLWFGHLESYWPNSAGHYDFELYADVMCKDIRIHHPGLYNCWDAAMPPTLSGGQWPAAVSKDPPLDGTGRHIFTYKRNSAGNLVKTTFNTANITPTDLGVSTTTDRNTIVNWVLGADQTGKRTRVDMNGIHWTLGDLIYSTPVVVGPPSMGAVSDATKAIISGSEVGIVTPPGNPPDTSTRYFLNWRQTDAPGRTATNPCPSAGTPSIKFRDKVVYVGGNDGMLHAVLLQVYDYKNKKWAKHPGEWNSITCADDKRRIQMIGKEIWAYMPSNLLTEIKSLAETSYAQTSGGCSHRFMVDLAPRGWEVFFDDEATTGVPWHTVLIGGERGGGDMYFALDVTDPWNPGVLWEYSVLKDMTVRFYADDAVTALQSACAVGTAINPGTVTACQVPVPPSGWWSGTPSACSSWSADTCKSNMNSAFGENNFWNPFDDSAYATLKKLPMSWSTPYVGRVKLPTGVDIDACPLGTGCVPNCPTGWSTVTGVQNFAFIGGGIKTFDPDLDIFDSFSSTSRNFYKAGFGHLLWEPFLLALDIRTGRNAFRYVWPEVVKQSSALFPKKQSTGCSGTDCQQIPYGMSDPVVLDLWSFPNGAAGTDGYDDSIYVADLNGLLYGIKLNFEDSAAGLRGIYVDLWKVKPIPLNLADTQDRYSNWYRSEIQPLTVQPALAFEPRDPGSTIQWLRLVIGAGKHDDIEGVKTDQTDVAKMSLYNLRELIDFGSLGGSSWTFSDTVKGGTIPNASGLNFRVRADCDSTTYRCTGEGTAESGCTWTAKAKDPSTGTDIAVPMRGCQWYNPNTGNPDCCESACNSPAQPCWACVFDLQESGEKVIGKPLIAGGVAFFTSFKPTTNDTCQAGGAGYLYAFDYMCRPFPPGFNPFQDITLGVETFPGPTGQPSVISGARVSLGAGVPSQPVLDSTGKFVIVQTSNAELFRVSVGLEERMQQIKGWAEKE